MECVCRPCKRLWRNFTNLPARGQRIQPSQRQRANADRASSPKRATRLTVYADKPTRRRPSEPIEAFFDLLVEAIERDEARQDMQGRLQTIEAELSEGRRILDEQMCVVEFLQTRVAEIEELVLSLRLASDKIETLQSQIQERVEMQNLLKRRLNQSHHPLSALFRQICSSADNFLGSIDAEGRFKGSVDGFGGEIVVPKDFANSLRMMTDCSHRLATRTHLVRSARHDLIKANHSTKLARSSQQRTSAVQKRSLKYDAVKDIEEIIHSQHKHQAEREQKFLVDHAKPLLIHINRMKRDHRLSDASSTSNVLLSSPHRNDQWSQKQHVKTVPDDGLQADTDKVASLRESRCDVKYARKNLETQQRGYADLLGGHLYCNRTSNKEEFDVLWEAWYEQNPHEQKSGYQDDLLGFQEYYKKDLDDANTVDKSVLLRSDWAGSSASDVEASQSPTTKYSMEPERAERRARIVRRYSRNVARRGPSLVSPSAAITTSPTSNNPAQSLDSWDRWMKGVTPSAINAEEQLKRVRRMKDRSAKLRQQFQRKGMNGPIYAQSPILGQRRCS